MVLGSAAGGIGTHETQHRKFLSSGTRSLSPHTLPAFLPIMAAGQLAIALGAKGAALHTATACGSGSTGIITAATMLHSGACDIAGGADAMITPLCTTAFARMRALSRRDDEPQHTAQRLYRSRRAAPTSPRALPR
ncbi:beta-ketoacyl synthase N-terminal-like domain-containing protein [Streptomyces sp. NPDC020379]|uniref:beta-ketoacyl synthase N-terminal-like domain-containing protein n=1 Tax=Streptomyces sp. NPDC020379 TaxID=3365071 RepID=UPI0037A82500